MKVFFLGTISDPGHNPDPGHWSMHLSCYLRDGWSQYLAEARSTAVEPANADLVDSIETLQAEVAEAKLQDDMTDAIPKGGQAAEKWDEQVNCHTYARFVATRLLSCPYPAEVTDSSDWPRLLVNTVLNVLWVYPKTRAVI